MFSLFPTTVIMVALLAWQTHGNCHDAVMYCKNGDGQVIGQICSDHCYRSSVNRCEACDKYKYVDRCKAHGYIDTVYVQDSTTNCSNLIDEKSKKYIRIDFQHILN